MTVGQAAFGRRAGHTLSARAFPWSRAGEAGHSALRTRPAAARRRAASPGGCVGDRRSRRCPGLCRRAAVRRARPAGEKKTRFWPKRHPRRQGGTQILPRNRQRRLEFLVLCRNPEAAKNSRASSELHDKPWCNTPSWTRVAGVLCPASKLWNTGHGQS